MIPIDKSDQDGAFCRKNIISALITSLQKLIVESVLKHSHGYSPCVYILLPDVGLEIHASSVTALCGSCWSVVQSHRRFITVCTP